MSAKEIIRPCIVIADGRAADQAVLAQALSHAGYDVLLASTGSEVLQHLAMRKVDVVIAAISMAELDGLELLRAMAGSADAPPVIVMAATNREIERVFLKGATLLGAAKTLFGPTPVPMLLDSVRDLLKN